MLKKKVILRVDGNAKIGLGHLIRCISLAHMLKQFYDVSFVCEDIPPKILHELNEGGFYLERIQNEDIFLRKISVDDIVVLDGYHFNTEYQKKIKETGCKLICIDDLHDKEFFADLIINHAPGITPNDYCAQPYTQFALGPDYALLRPDFLAQTQIKRNVNKTNTVLICFGGSDYKNLTESTLKTVLTQSNFNEIIVITGAAFLYLDKLKPILNIDNRISHYHAITQKEILSLMLKADLAIVPASGILFEALATGCKVISGYYVDNQMGIYNGFKSLNSFIDAGNFNPEQLTRALDKMDEYIPNYTFDGMSSDRLLEKIKNLNNVGANIN